MSTAYLVVLLSPLWLLLAVLGVVAIVAIVQADPKDIPELARVFCSVLKQLVGRIPTSRGVLSPPADLEQQENELADNDPEEGRTT